MGIALFIATGYGVYAKGYEAYANTPPNELENKLETDKDLKEDLDLEYVLKDGDPARDDVAKILILSKVFHQGWTREHDAAVTRFVEKFRGGLMKAARPGPLNVSPCLALSKLILSDEWEAIPDNERVELMKLINDGKLSDNEVLNCTSTVNFRRLLGRQIDSENDAFPNAVKNILDANEVLQEMISNGKKQSAIKYLKELTSHLGINFDKLEDEERHIFDDYLSGKRLESVLSESAANLRETTFMSLPDATASTERLEVPPSPEVAPEDYLVKDSFMSAISVQYVLALFKEDSISIDVELKKVLRENLSQEYLEILVQILDGASKEEMQKIAAMSPTELYDLIENVELRFDS